MSYSIPIVCIYGQYPTKARNGCNGCKCNANTYKNDYRTHQWTKALLAYIKSNFLSSPTQASLIEVLLERQQTARVYLAKSPFGTTVGGW